MEPRDLHFGQALSVILVQLFYGPRFEKHWFLHKNLLFPTSKDTTKSLLSIANWTLYQREITF